MFLGKTIVVNLLSNNSIQKLKFPIKANIIESTTKCDAKNLQGSKRTIIVNQFVFSAFKFSNEYLIRETNIFSIILKLLNSGLLFKKLINLKQFNF